MTTSIVYGDARDEIIEDGSVQCWVTSPPYFGLRSYGDSPKEIGRGSLSEYIADIRLVVQRMMAAMVDDGVGWLNIGDTASGSGGAGGDFKSTGSKADLPTYRQGATDVPRGQWCLVPQRVAIALQEDGWLIRSYITWDKGVVRPESVHHTKRPGVSSETILMLTKQRKYKFNASILAADGLSKERHKQERGNVWHFSPTRGKRNHMAPFPDELPRRCIELSTDSGDTVLDPFVGSGTTLRVANEMGRNAIGIDLYNFKDGIMGTPV